MYIHQTSKGTYWVVVDPARAGWYGLGKDDEWLGSYPSPEWAVKEVNKHLGAPERWETVFEYKPPRPKVVPLAA